MAIFGILSGGLSIYRYNMIADLAQEGARWGAVRGLTSPAAMKAQGTVAGILAQLQARNPGVPITVTVVADPNTLAAGASLSVTVNSTWLPVTSFVNLTAFQMTANAKMIMAR